MCKEKNVSQEELAKLFGVDVDEFCQLQNNYENRGFDQRQLEKIAMHLGVTATYLKGNTPYVSKEEREYRKKLKQMAQSQLDMTEYNFHPSNNLDSGYGVTVSVTAQLCIAANLVTLIERAEDLSDKISELDNTLYSLGMAVSSHP
ncbi:helix-turn-helix transcriptional regulator [Lactobacillus sp. wkB10]|uniref:helix-turn-helix domain-containing protein n=1 Tax=Lactobacillus sp. wkB10 TaxID=1545701 RepID=UPI001268BF81|nr:helix-turn-helix transcriptional regulator [Lactobacillus sp. wkB10]